MTEYHVAGSRTTSRSHGVPLAEVVGGRAHSPGKTVCEVRSMVGARTPEASVSEPVPRSEQPTTTW